MKLKNLQEQGFFYLHSWNIFSREAVCRVRNEHARLSNSTITNNNTLDRTTLSHYRVADNQVLYCPVPNKNSFSQSDFNLSPKHRHLSLTLQNSSLSCNYFTRCEKTIVKRQRQCYMNKYRKKKLIKSAFTFKLL